jgi:hypothetical protein
VLTVAAKLTAGTLLSAKTAQKRGEPRKLDQENKTRIHQPQMDAGIFVQKSKKGEMYMIKIKTQADLKQLQTCCEISPEYYQLVEQYFYQLIEALCPLDSDPATYNLENNGYRVVLNSWDNPHKLREVGLPDGIAQSFFGPEWSEFHQLSDQTICQIAYMYDNDFIKMYFLNQAHWTHDPIMQQFLQDQWAEEEIYKEGSDL